jgi:hypothetical protein
MAEWASFTATSVIVCPQMLRLPPAWAMMLAVSAAWFS